MGGTFLLLSLLPLLIHQVHSLSSSLSPLHLPGCEGRGADGVGERGALQLHESLPHPLQEAE